MFISPYYTNMLVGQMQTSCDCWQWSHPGIKLAELTDDFQVFGVICWDIPGIWPKATALAPRYFKKVNTNRWLTTASLWIYLLSAVNFHHQHFDAQLGSFANFKVQLNKQQFIKQIQLHSSNP